MWYSYTLSTPTYNRLHAVTHSLRALGLTLISIEAFFFGDDFARLSATAFFRYSKASCDNRNGGLVMLHLHVARADACPLRGSQLSARPVPLFAEPLAAT